MLNGEVPMTKILCVDDSSTIRDQLRELLEANGYQVVEAENGLKAIEAVKAHSDIKLIFCDVHMPELDGLSACQRIKEENLAPNVPIIMLTTETSATLKAASKAAGVVAWVTKPGVPEKILAAVKKLTAETTAA